MNLPLSYQWLTQEPSPRHLLKALELYGITEVVGEKDNPVILEWAKELGLEKVYTEDSIPWCALFVSIIMKRAGREPVEKPLWALNWANFGVKVGKPMLGDILVFKRNGGGHVGIYVGDGKFIHSPRAGGEVRIESMADTYWRKRFNGARRVQGLAQSNSLDVPATR